LKARGIAPEGEEMFIQTETTPNPATLKFLPGRVVLGSGTADFRSLEEAHSSPLAERLFGVPGVSGVFLGNDFVAVTKSSGEWPHIKPAILGAIMEHFMAGIPVLIEEPVDADDDEFFDEADTDIVDTIKELIETRVRPAVAQDGGDITFKGFREGTVYLNMRGACSGCPSSTATLKHGIENLLRHYVPEVRDIQQVEA
jgi:Fe-S cluster biogenesis protein NfuA